MPEAHDEAKAEDSVTAAAAPGFTEEQRRQTETVRRWLDERWPQPRQCPVCQQTTIGWEVGPLAEVRTWQGGNLFIGGPIYPIAPVMCLNCGYLIFINAIKAGAVPADPIRPDGPERTEE